MMRVARAPRPLVVAALLVSACDARDRRAVSKEPPLDTALLSRIEARFAARLGGTRYMEQACEPGEYPGWAGFPLRKCRYSQTDRDGTLKSATVIMLNPSTQQLSRWVAYACRSARRLGQVACADTLVDHVLDVSGAQFPVAGLVLEDQLPKDHGNGVHEMYCFRDGVTVVVRGVVNGATHAPTEEELAACLNGAVVRAKSYARIQSTTPQQYRDNGGADVGPTDSPTAAWRRVIRESYQAAWGSDRNELMIAWVRASL